MKYESKVIGTGAAASAFLEEDFFITFGEEAPAELKDYCYIIEKNRVSEEITAGDKLSIDGTSYEITAVGDIVSKNLENLGHITVRFDGKDTAEQSGTLHVEVADSIELDSGSTLSIG
jgi:PTS system glucitol/sorbitol-specific IIA component